MDDVVNDDLRLQEHLDRVVTALRAGVILLDSNREIAWMDERTRRRLNGGAEQFAAMLRTLDTGLGIDCCLCPQEIVINGKAVTVCLIQERERSRDDQGHNGLVTLEAAMADPSWFTRAILETLKAFRQTKRPVPGISDLDILSDREREVLALICEGRTDAQMGTMLNLSQNTIRNHIASLYRKIGVNRRSGAIIWARERGITPQDALPLRRRTAARRNPTYGYGLLVGWYFSLSCASRAEIVVLVIHRACG